MGTSGGITIRPASEVTRKKKTAEKVSKEIWRRCGDESWDNERSDTTRDIIYDALLSARKEGAEWMREKVIEAIGCQHITAGMETLGWHQDCMAPKIRALPLPGEDEGMTGTESRPCCWSPDARTSRMKAADELFALVAATSVYRDRLPSPLVDALEIAHDAYYRAREDEYAAK